MENWRQAKYIYSRAGLAFGLFLLLSTLLQQGVYIVFIVLEHFGFSIPMESWGMLVVMLPMYAVAVPISYLVMKTVPAAANPQRRPIGMKKLIVLFFICIAAMYIGNILGIALMSGINGIMGKQMANPVSELIDQMDVWTIVVLMVVIAPLAEEFLFRKLLIDRTVQFGDKTAILMSGILFGLSHGNFYQFFYAFALGVVFAYIYIRTGNIWYTVIFHAIINFMGSVVALQVLEHPVFAVIYGLFLLTSLGVGLGFLIARFKKAELREGICEIPRGQRFKTCFCNWGMALFFLVSMALFAVTQLVA